MKFRARWQTHRGGITEYQSGWLVGPVVHANQLYLVVLPQYSKEPIMLPATEVELTPEGER
jgi:hypothetical protein